MKKSGKFSVIAAGALALTSLFGMSAFADSRHPDDATWRESHRGHDRYEDRRRDRRDRRRDHRDLLSGYVERVDRRRGIVLLRDRRGGRPIAVEMTRRNTRGIDLEDLRRGDYVTFAGDWSRGGVFEARRIETSTAGAIAAGAGSARARTWEGRKPLPRAVRPRWF